MTFVRSPGNRGVGITGIGSFESLPTARGLNQKGVSMKLDRLVCHKARRIALALAIVQFGAGACLCQQSASTPLAFEVASIKPCSKEVFCSYPPSKIGPHVYPGSASYIGMSLKSLFVYAYGVNINQVTGPGWMDTDRYVIEARFPEGATGKDEKRMLQELMKERFKLAFHIEKKDETAYQLVVGEQGAKLKPFTEYPSGTDKEAPLKPGEQWTGEGPEKHKELYTSDAARMVNHLESDRVTMSALARVLTAIFNDSGDHYLVVDRTGLEGYYQVSIDYSPPQARATVGGDAVGAPPSDPQGTDVLDRSLDALGLKLKLQKGPVDFYVVDHSENPSAN